LYIHNIEYTYVYIGLLRCNVALTEAIGTPNVQSRCLYRRSSRDSVLEAFRHNPTDGSFAALAAQPTALPNIRTNGSSRTKLDYCRDDNLISRVKLTCLTTV